MIKTIPNDANIDHITYIPTFSAICSVGKAPFHGEIGITYSPAETLLEFESFESWIRTFAMQEMTIEQMTRLIFDELSEVLDGVPLRVTIRAQTTVHAPVTATIKQGEI